MSDVKKPVEELDAKKVIPEGNAPTEQPNQNYEGLRRERDNIALERAKAVKAAETVKEQSDNPHEVKVAQAESALVKDELDVREAIVAEHLGRIEG